jgi:hypothetical protein
MQEVENVPISNQPIQFLLLSRYSIITDELSGFMTTWNILTVRGIK